MSKNAVAIPKPKTLDTMTTEELNAKFAHSYLQVLARQGRPAEDVFADLERKPDERQVV